ncbi:NAD(P)-dependent dehydrogenase (short-subunit alcohol dehydrogenase family) [Actinoallomurus bryophytorum]|uniref:NAD(P)-dependent dehydrogenase (Short-subunit alcohol dehydrogenase family) n=1 Tax=Actinoallomurus bryophytorum TaxID=1490222 RepID=A0A543CCX1_9ACTN|nr:SDR family oxidoreductase [Actinoallomurus bryophytorum]TQL94938.1 NAD(P)-dependent dehydrogenase (short-subunit alcohol dehydrogenase family) [Actinoallomurus bryophytorum]
MCDLADPAAVRAAADRTVETYGRLDVAFDNDATISPPGPMDQVPEADFDRLYAVYLKDPWLAMTAEVAAIRATARTGAIVDNSSVGSLMGDPELPAYGTMQRAVNSLTESAAVTSGPEGIRVNAIALGNTLTETSRTWEADSPGLVERLEAQTPLRRAADPDEIAQAAAWLLSDRSSYVTGTVLRVDAGARACPEAEGRTGTVRRLGGLAVHLEGDARLLGPEREHPHDLLDLRERLGVGPDDVLGQAVAGVDRPVDRVALERAV